jgi:putative peptidoglycan lipid II flippase
MLIGNAISTAAFPRLTDRLAQGRVDLFRKEFLRVLTTMIWIILPISIVAYFTRGYLARIIFARDNREIAAIFGFLTIAILFRTLYTIISRYFYAHKDTKTPLYVSLFVIALNIYLAYNLSKATAYGVVGLALAQSIVAFVEVVILVLIMIKRDRTLFNKPFLVNLLKIISVTGFTALAGFLAVQIFPLLKTDQGVTIIGKLILITGIVFGTHVIVSYLYDIREAKFVFDKLRRMILRPIKL